MPTRPLSLGIAVLLAGFTVWITRQAKTLESDLTGSALKIALLDKAAPDFHQTTLDGHPIALSDYRGKKKLVLAFLAGWNNASHAQMMMLRDLYQINHQPDSDFDLVAFTLDDDRASAQSFATESKAPFPMVFDEGRTVSNAYQIRSLPTLLLIDTDGKVVYGSAGPNQRGQNDIAQRLGIRPRDFRMEMRSPNAGRGN